MGARSSSRHPTDGPESRSPRGGTFVWESRHPGTRRVSPAKDNRTGLAPAVREQPRTGSMLMAGAGPGLSWRPAQERWAAQDTGKLSVFGCSFEGSVQLNTPPPRRCSRSRGCCTKGSSCRVAPPPQPGFDPDRLVEWNIINWGAYPGEGCTECGCHRETMQVAWSAPVPSIEEGATGA